MAIILLSIKIALGFPEIFADNGVLVSAISINTQLSNLF